MIDYKKRLVELEEVLKHLSKEDYEKIPDWLIKGIKDNKDESYMWNYDENKTLKEQNIAHDTIVMLSFINIKYLLTEEQKKLMKEFYKLNSKKIENQCLKNDGSNLFEDKTESDFEHIDYDIKDKKTNILVCKESFFKRIFKKIFKIR